MSIVIITDRSNSLKNKQEKFLKDQNYESDINISDTICKYIEMLTLSGPLMNREFSKFSSTTRLVSFVLSTWSNAA